MARWTDLAPRQEYTTHQTVGGMRSHRGVVQHTASGYYEGTISWQKKNLADMRAAGEDPTSSHFVVSKAGDICQMVDTNDRAWAQGSGNPDWLSIENEGFGGSGGQALTAAQVEANARIFARAKQVYGFPLILADSPAGWGLGHHGMGGAAWGGHYDCPGPPIVAQKPAVLARAQRILSPPPASRSGDDMPNGELGTGFGIAETNDWIDQTRAVAVPLPAVGSGAGQWGDAWLYLAGAGNATLRYGCFPSGHWADASVTLTSAVGPLALPAGTTELLITRKRTAADDAADSAPVRWHVQYAA